MSLNLRQPKPRRHLLYLRKFLALCSMISLAHNLKKLSSLPLKHKPERSIASNFAAGLETHSTQVRARTFLKNALIAESVADTPHKRTGVENVLRACKQTLDILIDALEDLDFLNYLGSLQTNHDLNRLLNGLYVISSITHYCHSSILKAEHCYMGKSIRKIILEREKMSCLGTCTSIPPSASIMNWTDLSIRDQKLVEVKVHRMRKAIMKDCKKVIDEIWWHRIGLICEGSFSVFNLLQDQCIPNPTRAIRKLLWSIFFRN